jgi:flagellar hook-basal body complex protein FliE
MTIQGIQAQLQQVQQLQQPAPTQNTAPAKANGADSFGQMLENALQEVTELQTQAENQIEAMATNKDGSTPHSVMVALEKADVAFQLMSAIRGKIIRAYEEVIRTQV